MSPALAGRFFTAEQSGKPFSCIYMCACVCVCINFRFFSDFVCVCVCVCVWNHCGVLKISALLRNKSSQNVFSNLLEAEF